MPKETGERDDIGRMIELNSRFEPAPGSAFKETLTELRRQHSSAEFVAPRRKSLLNRLVLAGLSLAAVLAVIFITLSLFAVFNNSNSKVAAPVAQVATATQPGSTKALATANPIVEITQIVASTDKPATAGPTSASTNIPAQTESAGTPASTTRAALTPLRPLATIASAGSNRIPTSFANTVSGTVTAFNQADMLLQITDLANKSVTVKLLSSTVVIRKGQPVNFSEIAVGDKLTASGKLDAQGQFEATSIALDILSQPRPIGDPGYPEEKK